MGDRRRNRSGGKLLIAIALGPICAVAAVSVSSLPPSACQRSEAVLQDTNGIESGFVETGLHVPAKLRGSENRSPRFTRQHGNTPGWLDTRVNLDHRFRRGDDGQLTFRSDPGPVDLQWFAQPTSQGP